MLSLCPLQGHFLSLLFGSSITMYLGACPLRLPCYGGFAQLLERVRYTCHQIWVSFCKHSLGRSPSPSFCKSSDTHAGSSITVPTFPEALGTALIDFFLLFSSSNFY